MICEPIYKPRRGGASSTLVPSPCVLEVRLQIRINSGVSIMSKPSLTGREHQQSSPFGLGHKQAKKAQKIRRKCSVSAPYPKKYGAFAPYLHHIQKIRSKCATVAPYLLCTRLRSSHRLRADRLFGLDPPAPVDHRLDQLADLLARALVMQVHLLVEESGGL